MEHIDVTTTQCRHRLRMLLSSPHTMTR
jgi:hypothetical protein